MLVVEAVGTMRFTLPEGTFPQLTLSDDQRKMLIEEADAVLRETMVAYDEYLGNRRQLSRQEWKLVKTKEQLRVFRQRKQARMDSMKLSSTYSTHKPSLVNAKDVRRPRAMSGSSENSRVSSSFSEAFEMRAANSDVPLLLSCGTIPGTLDDFLLGSVGSDDVSWRQRSSYVKDGLEDVKLLATIQTASQKDPFRFLGIKWFTKEHPAALKTIVKRRDFVILEGMGLARNAAGERVGYYLMHSIDLPEVRELREIDIIRGKLSFCYIARPEVDIFGATDKLLDLFCLGFSEPKGGMPDMVSALICVSMLSAANVIECSHTRKLCYLLSNKSKACTPETRPRNDICATCTRKVNSFGSFISGASCQICREMACSKCSITRKITVDFTKLDVIQRTMTFCSSCVVRAKQLSAWQVALTEHCSSTDNECRGIGIFL